MSQKEKLLEKLIGRKGFTFVDLESLFSCLGFEKGNKGKTSGSRVMYTSVSGKKYITHKPHPGKDLQSYQVAQVIEFLKEEGIL